MHASSGIVWITDRPGQEFWIGSEFDGHSLKLTGAVSNSGSNTVPYSEMLFYNKAITSNALTTPFTTVRLAFMSPPSKELLVVGLSSAPDPKTRD